MVIIQTMPGLFWQCRTVRGGRNSFSESYIKCTVPINVCRWLKLTSRRNLHRRSQVKLRSIEVSSGTRLRSYWGVGCPIGGHNDQWDCSPTTDNMYFPSSTTVPSSQSSLGRTISSDTTLPLSGHAFCPPFYVEPGVAGQHYLYSLLDQGQYG